MRKSLLTAFFVLLSCFTSAQTMFGTEYPRYGFWSNWSLSLQGDFDKQGNGNGYAVGEGTDFGASISAEKELSYVFDARLRISMQGFLSNDGLQRDERFARFGMVSLGAKCDILGLFGGYNPYRMSSLYVFANGGVAVWHNYFNAKNSVDRLFNPTLSGGIGYSYHVSTHSVVFAEAEMLCMSHIPNIFKGVHYRLDANVSLGYAYDFGVTEADAVLIEQRSMLTEEAFDSLQMANESLGQKVFDGKENIKKLKVRVEELEAENKGLVDRRFNELALECRVKRLDSLIGSIKAEQIHFYALPFSVLFDVDKDYVKPSEYDKIRAVARVMSMDTTVCFVVCGFADYTGSDEHNMDLSCRRANNVVSILVKKFDVRESQIVVDYKGKRMPFGDEKFGVNRKVSFYKVIE